MCRAAQARAEFDDYCRSKLNIKLGAAVLLLGMAWSFSRDPIITHGYGSGVNVNTLFLVQFLVGLLVTPIVVVSWFLRLAFISRRYDIVRMLPYHDWAVGVSQSPYRNLCENAVMILVPLKIHLFVLASVVQSACPPGTSLWNARACDYKGSHSAVPIDALLLCFVAPILCQHFVLGASKVGYDS